MKRVLAAAGIAGLATAVMAGPAAADPKSGFLIDLDCGDGEVQVVSSDNNAPWSPALDTGSNAVYQPLGFKDETGLVEVLDGPNACVTFEFDSEDTMKNGKRKGVDVQECSFSSEAEFFEEELEGNIHLTISGTVYLKTTAR